MSPPVLIVSEQLNYTKPDGIHAIFMPVMIEFSRYICTYSSAKFEYIINMYGISVDDLLEIIKKQCKDAEILKGLVIKYNIIGKVSIIDTIVKRVSSFAVGTKEMLEKCLVILDSVI